MRCQSCDQNLSDHESTRKGLFTGEYIDMCDKCLATINVDEEITINPEDLLIEDYDHD